MLENMKLGNKIWLGFGGLLAIAGSLGVVAIVAMNGVRTDATALSQEYVPEVVVANDLERASFLTMYNVRGYHYTGDVKLFLDPAKIHLAEVEKSLKTAEELAGKSAHLAELKKNAATARAKVAEYKALLQETESVRHEIEKGEEIVNKNSEIFDEGMTEYHENQNKKFSGQIAKGDSKAKLDERLLKLSEGTDIAELGAQVRIARLRSEADRDLSFYEKSRENFDKIAQRLAHLKSISIDPLDLADISKVGEATERYKQAADQEFELRKKLDDLGKKRGEVANAVLEAAKTTAVTGAERTSAIAQASATALAAATFILVIGLLAAVAIGLGLAFFVTKRNVSRNLRQFSHLFNITNFPLVPPIRGADTAPR